MKRFFLALLILFISPGLLFAAGSCTQTNPEAYTGGFTIIRLVCTGDSSDGSIPNTALSAANLAIVQGTHYLYTVSAYPTAGGTAPDAADVFILDANGEDLLGSTDGGTTANKGANLIHATLKKTTWAYSHFLSSAYFPPVIGSLTLKVSNQATASANYTIELVFVR
jgi:hypothetical protein